MRNYLWVTEFSSKEHFDKLDAFDDEYFVLLRNNKPVFIAFPNWILKEVDKEYDFKIEIVSWRDIIRSTLKVSEGSIVHIIRDNEHIYNVIPYWAEESNFIHREVLKLARRDAFNILWINWAEEDDRCGKD